MRKKRETGPLFHLEPDEAPPSYGETPHGWAHARKEPAGYLCPQCTQSLVWLNGSLLEFRRHDAWCRSCGLVYQVDHKELVSRLPAGLLDRRKVVPAAFPEDEACTSSTSSEATEVTDASPTPCVPSSAALTTIPEASTPSTPPPRRAGRRSKSST